MNTFNRNEKPYEHKEKTYVIGDASIKESTRTQVLELSYDTFPIVFRVSGKQNRKLETKASYDPSKGIIVRKREVVNEKNVGKPKFIKINGQNTWDEFTKGRAKDFCKKFLVDSLTMTQRQFIRNHFKSYFPLIIECHIHTVISHGGITMKNGWYQIPEKPGRWDIGNLGLFWTKVFDDALQDAKVIPDDSIKYIVGTGGTFFHEVDDIDKRKLVFKFFI